MVTYAIGHLVSIDDSAAPPKWSLDTIPIFPARFGYTVNKMTSKQFKVVKGLLKTATEVVVATDAGREGELIARLILHTERLQRSAETPLDFEGAYPSGSAGRVQEVETRFGL